MAGQAPEAPPWDPDFYEAGSATDLDLKETGFDEYIAAGALFDTAYDNRAAQIFPGITRELKEAAQERSPYLYGILHGAHLNETFTKGDGMQGVVHIDPNVWHPVLGGRPIDYGSRIHNQGRPWFGWTVGDEAESIISKYGAELLDVVGDVYNQQRAAAAMNAFL